MSLVDEIQSCVLYLFCVNRPTMRTQNFYLEILEQLEDSRTASKNGLYIDSEQSVVTLQYSKFKTSASYGFIKFELNADLSALIIKFVYKIRPWFFANPSESDMFNSKLFVSQNGTIIYFIL